MKTTLNKLLMCVATFTSLIIPFSCDDDVPVTNYILRSTFENDVIGELPDKTLPGDPTGDELQYVDGSNMEIVPSPSAPLSKSLKLTTHGSAIEFDSKPSSFQGAVVTFTWAGRLTSHYTDGWSGRKTIDIKNDLGKKLARFTIYGGYVIIKSKVLDDGWEGPGEGLFLGENLGLRFKDPFPPYVSPSDDPHHVFIIAVNLVTKTYDLTLAGGSGLVSPVYKKENIPFYDPTASFTNYMNSGRPRARLTITNVEGGYILDEVFISRKSYEFVGPPIPPSSINAVR